MSTIIRHCISRPDGTQSVWDAVSDSDYNIIYEVSVYTLDTFVNAHYIAQGITSWKGKGWDECEIRMFEEWFKLALCSGMNVRKTTVGSHS